MDPIMGGVISGSLGLLGNLFGTSANNKNAMEMQQQAQQFNAAQTMQQQQFQEQMSSSAYQRASKDMTAAGLNPAMMFSSGSAASAPAGAAAVTSPAVKTSALTTIGPAMDRIVSSAVQAKTFEKMVDEIANLKATNERTQAEILTEKGRSQLVGADTLYRHQQARNEGLKTYGALRDAVEATSEKELLESSGGRFLTKSALAGKKASDTLAPLGDVINSAGSILRGLSAHNFKMRWPDRYETTILPSGKRVVKESIYSK